MGMLKDPGPLGAGFFQFGNPGAFLQKSSANECKWEVSRNNTPLYR